MDYDEFSADDFIGATRVKLYECLYAPNHNISIRRLLDDNIVSCGAPDIQDSHTLPSVMYTYELASSPGLLTHPLRVPLRRPGDEAKISFNAAYVYMYIQWEHLPTAQLCL